MCFAGEDNTSQSFGSRDLSGLGEMFAAEDVVTNEKLGIGLILRVGVREKKDEVKGVLGNGCLCEDKASGISEGLMMEKVSMMLDREGDDGRVTVKERGTVENAPSMISRSGWDGRSNVVRKGEPRTVLNRRLNRGVGVEESMRTVGDGGKDVR